MITRTLTKFLREQLPGHLISGSFREGRPYHLKRSFRYYELVAKVPGDKYAPFRLYFTESVECVYCLHFTRAVGKRRVYDGWYATIDLRAEDGWDRLAEWLAANSGT